VEWSYGGCAEGSGMYGIGAKNNPYYKFRETVCLGTTPKTQQEVRARGHVLV